jgi:hypothetical protein
MQPHHNRTLATIPYAGRPHIQYQAGFTLWQVSHVPIGTDDCVRPGFVDQHSYLRADWSEVTGVSYAGPRLNRQRWQETTLAAGRSTIWHAFEGQDTSLLYATNIPGGRFDYNLNHGLLLSIGIWQCLIV